MNYKESKLILKEIKKAKKILIGCHKNPDGDTVGCALSLYQVLRNWKIKAQVVCSNKLPQSLNFIPFSDVIEQIDFNNYKFENHSAFIAVDTPDEAHVTGSKKIPLPPIPIFVIDHHKTNPKYGKINLIDEKISSAAEILFLVLKDWEANVTKGIATTLLTGIISDTGIFKYPEVTVQTLVLAKELIEKGANKNEIILNLFNSIEHERLKLWGEIINRMQIDTNNHFAWSAIPLEVYKEFSGSESGRESFASMFGGAIKDTDFSIIMTEEYDRFCSISLRSRTEFDVSKIAVKLGGGGHKAAAGAKIEGLGFDEAVDKVLRVARKFAKK